MDINYHEALANLTEDEIKGLRYPHTIKAPAWQKYLGRELSPQENMIL